MVEILVICGYFHSIQYCRQSLMGLLCLYFYDPFFKQGEIEPQCEAALLRISPFKHIPIYQKGKGLVFVHILSFV